MILSPTAFFFARRQFPCRCLSILAYFSYTPLLYIVPLLCLPALASKYGIVSITTFSGTPVAKVTIMKTIPVLEGPSARSALCSNIWRGNTVPWLL